MDDESIAKRPNESLKEEIFSKFKLKMLTSGFTQDQCELAAACFYYCTKGIQFSKTCKDLVATDPTSNYFLVKKFIATKMLEGLSEKTLKNYTREIVNLGKQVRLDKAGTDDIRSYLAQYRLRGASNRTADNARRYLSSFYAWLTAEDFVAKNPMLRIKKIKCEKTLKEPFSEVEMEKLRSACVDVRERALIEVLLSTGCRASEIANAKLSRVNLGTGELRVIGKGSKERIVYFNASAKFWFMKYKAQRSDNVDALFIGTRHNSQKEITSLRTSGVEIIVRRLGRRAGVQNCHPHRFRRTAATWASKRGMPVEQVQKMLGHSSIDTTMIYTCVDQADVKRSHEKYLGG